MSKKNQKHTTEIVSENNENEKKQLPSKEEEIEYYLELKNWKLSSEVDNDSFESAFPNIEERLAFMHQLKDYYNARIDQYKLIEKKLPKNRNSPYFFKARKFREGVLKGPKQGAIMAVQRLEQSIEDLENEIQEENNEETEI